MNTKRIMLGVMLSGMASAALAVSAPKADEAPAAPAATPAALTMVDCDTNGMTTSLVKIESIQKDETNRIITSGKGEKIYFRFTPDAQGKVDATGTITETARKSRIREETESVLKAGFKDGWLSPFGFAEGEPPKTCYLHTAQFKRGTLAVEVTQKNAGAADVVHSGKVLIGPAEHWYLSADMPVSNVDQLKYDSATNTFVEKAQPASFYASINGRLGDVYTHYSWKDYHKTIALKGMFKASSRPTESMGIGLGFPVPWEQIPLELFVAHVWTKADSNGTGTSLKKSDDTVFGITFNISKGLAWFKGDGDAK